MKGSSIKKIINLLKKEYPKATIGLFYSNALELLIATMLSAQCPEARVNEVTKSLFAKYKTIKDWINLSYEKLSNEIKTIPFCKMKAKNIINTCRLIYEKYDGKVPNNMKDLLALPGIARKTANIILGTLFKIPSGIAVDTHVMRLSQLIGLSKNKNPEKIEKDLMKIIPKKDWIKISYLLMSHGRKICISKKPKCNICTIRKYCQAYKNIKINSKGCEIKR